MDKSFKIIQPNPPAAKYAVKGHKILERDLPVPDGKILKNNIISEGNNKQKVHRSVAFNFAPKGFITGLNRFGRHISKDNALLKENKGD